MTERLSDLLLREADQIDVPAPPAAAVIARGRGLRRRRTTTRAVAAVATLAVIGTGVAVAADRGDVDSDSRRIDPARPTPAATIGVAFSIGNRVYLDGGARAASVDDASVKSMFYTSAGLVVRHGDNPNSDGGGPQRFSLVSAEGAVRPLALETEEVNHASDPAQPYLAYAESVGGVVLAVVLDVRTQDEVARVPLPDHSGGFAPVSLSGDTLYIGDPEGQHTFAVAWRTGEVTRGADTLDEVAGGHAPGSSVDGPTVMDTATGEVLLQPATPPGGYAYFVLSPDGRYAELVSTDKSEEVAAPVIYDVESGTSVDLPAATSGYGWSSDSETLFSVSDTGEVQTCAASTGTCATTRPVLAVTPDQYSDPGESPGDDLRDDLRLGGRIYES